MHHRFGFVLLIFSSLLVIACGGDSGNDNRKTSEIPDTTTPFSGPLTAMSNPVTFNSASVGISRESSSISPPGPIIEWLRERNEGDQVTINPTENTFQRGNTKPFNSIFFTTGTEIFAEGYDRFSNNVNSVTDHYLIVAIPGTQGSGQEWVSHATWEMDHRVFYCFIFTCWSERSESAGSLLFGIRTPPAAVPDIGLKNYTGYASGYFSVFSAAGWSRVRFRSEVQLAIDFETGTIEIRLFGFTEGADEVGSDELVLESSTSGIDLSGDLSGTSACEILSGELVGNLYGPNAHEVGGVFRTHVCGDPMLGSFVVRGL